VQGNIACGVIPSILIAGAFYPRGHPFSFGFTGVSIGFAIAATYGVVKSQTVVVSLFTLIHTSVVLLARHEWNENQK
jgi:uncharacterized membrane protein